METLIIDETPDTPEIMLDRENLTIRIEGSSYPENALTVYNPVLDWIENLGQKLPKPLVCEFHFNYISSSSKKLMYAMFLLMKELLNNGNQVIINWYHDEHDDDMLELGEEFSELTDVPIVIKI